MNPNLVWLKTFMKSYIDFPDGFNKLKGGYAIQYWKLGLDLVTNHNGCMTNLISALKMNSNVSKVKIVKDLNGGLRVYFK